MTHPNYAVTGCEARRAQHRINGGRALKLIREAALREIDPEMVPRLRPPPMLSEGGAPDEVLLGQGRQRIDA